MSEREPLHFKDLRRGRPTGAKTRFVEVKLPISAAEFVHDLCAYAVMHERVEPQNATPVRVAMFAIQQAVPDEFWCVDCHKRFAKRAGRCERCSKAHRRSQGAEKKVS